MSLKAEATPLDRQHLEIQTTKPIAVFPDGTMVTGTSGFIGSHLCETLARKIDPVPQASNLVRMNLSEGDTYVPSDVCSERQLRHLGEKCRVHTVVHLAAKGSVLTPLSDVPDLLNAAVFGTLNILRILNPGKFILASSSAVYGNSGPRGARPAWRNVNPTSLYGLSKATAELISKQWARETGNTAIILRFGNVIGRRCPGLISFLVRHAIQYPDGSTPAEMRGGGRIIRDYVPIHHVIRITLAIMEENGKAGTSVVFNVGTGRGMSNADVAAVAQEILAKKGYMLNIHWNNSIAPAEARKVVLAVAQTKQHFGIPAPTQEDVLEAIKEATLDWLERLVPDATPAQCSSRSLLP